MLYSATVVRPVFVIGILALSPVQGADLPKGSERPDTTLEGKALYVRMKADTGVHEEILGKAQVRRLGDRWFLVGRPVSLKTRVQSPYTKWVSLQDVVYIEEFADLDEMAKHYLPKPAEGK